MANTDSYYLKHALSLAQSRRGFCAPNPSVGCVIVKDDQILSTGFHIQAGKPHAEAMALTQLKHQAQGATAYVTLEPCCHYGRTPPCTEALIKAGIKRVVYAFPDPNPIVAGKGENVLRAAEIACEHQPIPEIDAFYRSYQHWHRTKTPWVTAKLAMTLNGMIAAEDGQPVQITGPELKKYTHQGRKTADAILTTAQTIRRDDPQLNVRQDQETIAKPLYILDSQLSLPLTAKIFKTTQSITIFHAKSADVALHQRLREQGARLIEVDETPSGLDLTQIIQRVGQDGIHDLWIEAGGRCFAAFYQSGLMQRALLYIAPLWLEKGKPAFPPGFSLDGRAQKPRWERYGEDVLCELSC